MSRSFQLDGKVAIVTGGGGAIGQDYGRGLAEAGACVALADLNLEAAKDAAAKLVADGLNAIAVGVDITSKESAAAMVSEVISSFGEIDILVNNSALMAEIPQVDILDLPTEWFERVMRVNVMGAVVCAGAVKESMVKQGRGRIIIQVSSGAFMAGGIYGTTKLALVSITAGLAKTLGPLGINVNAIAPGMMESEPGLRSLAADHPARAAIAAAVPGQKVGDSGDLMGTLLLLASPAGQWINGQTISVDGGLIVRL